MYECDTCGEGDEWERKERDEELHGGAIDWPSWPPRPPISVRRILTSPRHSLFFGTAQSRGLVLSGGYLLDGVRGDFQ